MTLNKPEQGYLATSMCLIVLVSLLSKGATAQSVYTVPQAAFSVLPDGFSRGLEEPVTTVQVPQSQNNSLIQQTTNSVVLAFTPDFATRFSQNVSLRLLAEKTYAFAHEAAVFLEATNEVFFTSNRVNDSNGQPTAELWVINIDTGALRQILPCSLISVPNGAYRYQSSLVLVDQGRRQGNTTRPAGLLSLDPYGGNCSWILNNFLGLQFNSPNDVVVTNNGNIFFTDPSYGTQQGFKGQPQLGNFVWRYTPSKGSVPRVVADELIRPNGLALSTDNSILYVSDSGAGVNSPTDPKTIYAFDIVGQNQAFLRNKRVFAFSDAGAPDGLKVDRKGNVWAGCADGLNVWNPEGDLIGKVPIKGGTSNFAFAGQSQNAVIILNEQKVYRLDLDA